MLMIQHNWLIDEILCTNESQNAMVLAYDLLINPKAIHFSCLVVETNMQLFVFNLFINQQLVHSSFRKKYQYTRSKLINRICFVKYWY